MTGQAKKEEGKKVTDWGKLLSERWIENVTEGDREGNGEVDK